MKYGYIRVSTKSQDETPQLEALRKVGVLKENIFTDKFKRRILIKIDYFRTMFFELSKESNFKEAKNTFDSSVKFAQKELFLTEPTIEYVQANFPIIHYRVF